MARIGSLGEIAFEVSGSLIRTFSERTESGSARYGIHEVAGARPVLEFTGPGVESIDLSVSLNAGLGVDVAADVRRAREYRDTGRQLSLYIGGEPIGDPGARWVIISVDVSYAPHTDRDGRPMQADLRLSLQQARSASTPAPLSTTVTKRNVTRAIAT